MGMGICNGGTYDVPKAHGHDRIASINMEFARGLMRIAKAAKRLVSSVSERLADRTVRVSK